MALIRAARASKGDATRSSRNVGAGCDGRCGVRRVLPCRTKTLTAYGEVVWSWRRDPGVKLAGVSRRRRWQNRPLTGESTKETVKPLRGESRDVLAVPVVQPVCIFCSTLAHGTAGAVGARLSLRPLSERDDELAKLRRTRAVRTRIFALCRAGLVRESTANESCGSSPDA